MGADRHNINWHLHNMRAGLNEGGSEPDPMTIYKEEAGIAICCGNTVPSGAGYAPGCLFIHTDGSSSDYQYVNNGTVVTADFEKVIDVNNVVGVVEGEHLSGTAAGVGPSPLIWDGAPVLDVLLDPTKGFYFFDDFLLPDVYASTVLNNGIVMTQQSGGGTLANDATVEGGVLKLVAPATDQDGPAVQWTGLQIMPTAGTTIYFEVRCKIGTDAEDVFIGLCDDADPDVLASGTILVNKDMCGFFRDDGTTDAEMGHQCSDGSTVDTADDTIADVDKDEYEKFGFVITGNGATATDSIKFYHNGALVKTMSDIADVPDGIMCPLIEITTDGGGTGASLDLDWMRVLVHHATGGCRES